MRWIIRGIQEFVPDNGLVYPTPLLNEAGNVELPVDCITGTRLELRRRRPAKRALRIRIVVRRTRLASRLPEAV